MTLLYVTLTLLASLLLVAGQGYEIQGLQCPPNVVEVDAGNIQLQANNTYILRGTGPTYTSGPMLLFDDQALCIIGTNNQTIGADPYSDYDFVNLVSSSARLGLANLTCTGSRYYSDNTYVLAARGSIVAMSGVTVCGQVAIHFGAKLLAENTVFVPKTGREFYCLWLGAIAILTGQTKFLNCFIGINIAGSNATLTATGPVEINQSEHAIIALESSSIVFHNQVTFMKNRGDPVVTVSSGASLVFKGNAVFQENQVAASRGLGCVLGINTLPDSPATTSVSAKSIELVGNICTASYAPDLVGAIAVNGAKLVVGQMRAIGNVSPAATVVLSPLNLQGKPPLATDKHPTIVQLGGPSCFTNNTGLKATDVLVTANPDSYPAATASLTLDTAGGAVSFAGSNSSVSNVKVVDTVAGVQQIVKVTCSPSATAWPLGDYMITGDARSCDAAFTNTGTHTCNSCGNGDYDSATCACKITTCPAIPGPVTPDNATPFNCSETQLAETCSTACQPGYESSQEILSTCQAGRVWSAVAGQCQEKGCAEQPVVPMNAMTYADCTTTPAAPAGSTCSTNCSPGYNMAGGTLDTICSKGAWSAVSGSCVAKDCFGNPGPATPANAMPFNCPDTKSGMDCSTSCLAGFTSNETITATCQLGTWSSATGLCAEQSCFNKPTAPVDAAAYDTCSLPALPGATCNTSCKSGYMLTSGSLSTTCSRGNWSSITGVCAAGSCSGNPTTPAAALPFNCTLTETGQECSTTCRPGYESGQPITSICQLGAWSNATGRCLASDCKQLPVAPAGARKHMACPVPATSGATCSTVCKSGYVLAYGSLSTKCNKGIWSSITGICVPLPTTPGCVVQCNCPNKKPCLNQQNCCWYEPLKKCFHCPKILAGAKKAKRIIEATAGGVKNGR